MTQREDVKIIVDNLSGRPDSLGVGHAPQLKRQTVTQVIGTHPGRIKRTDACEYILDFSHVHLYAGIYGQIVVYLRECTRHVAVIVDIADDIAGYRQLTLREVGLGKLRHERLHERLARGYSHRLKTHIIGTAVVGFESVGGYVVLVAIVGKLHLFGRLAICLGRLFACGGSVDYFESRIVVHLAAHLFLYLRLGHLEHTHETHLHRR